MITTKQITTKRIQFFHSVKAQPSQIVSAGEYEARIVVGAMCREFNIYWYDVDFTKMNKKSTLDIEIEMQSILTIDVWNNSYENEHSDSLFEREFKARMEFVTSFIRYHYGMMFIWFLVLNQNNNKQSFEIEFRRIA